MNLSVGSLIVESESLCCVGTDNFHFVDVKIDVQIAFDNRVTYFYLQDCKQNLSTAASTSKLFYF